MLTLLQITISSVTLLVLSKILFRNRKLDHIPSVGYTSPFLSFFSAVKFLYASRQIIEEGYRKYPGQIWKISMLDEWLVVANGLQQVDDMRKASEEYLLGSRTNPIFYQFDHSIGADVTLNPFHIKVVRGPITHNMGDQFDDLRDEMLQTYSDVFNAQGKEWVSVPLFESLVEIVSRVTSRAFVGLPLSHEKGFRKLCNDSALELVKGRLLYLFPAFTRPFLARYVTRLQATLSGLESYLGPIVEYRLEQEKLFGDDWPDKPEDIITWTMAGAKASGEDRTGRYMAKRMLLYSFASTHTSALIFSQALQILAARQEYIQPLREEAEAVIGGEGWTKAAIGKLYKMDSFMRESARFYGLALVMVNRRVVKDFAFSDGTVVPAGTHLAANAWGIQRDEKYYPNPDTFDGFRFVREDGVDQALMAVPTLEYVGFGLGRAACPGRFFAAVELKMLLAEMILTYDIKLDEGSGFPEISHLESKAIPDTASKLMLRKREV